MHVYGGNEMESNDDRKYTFPVGQVKQQFLSPFLLKEGKIESLVSALLADDFIFFDISDEAQEDKYYGETRIFHHSLETYFMPNIEPTLFPQSVHDKKSIRRFSKELNQAYNFKSKHLELDFIMESIDVYICPFHIGLINIRISLPIGLTNNDVATFGDLFSFLVPNSDYRKDIQITCEHEQFEQVKDLIFKKLLQRYNRYIDGNHAEMKSYFGSLPFYKDERMYVISYMQHEKADALSELDVYRTSQLNGYQVDGSAYIGASNPDYIKRFCQKHVYDRWGVNTYYAVTDYHFVCLTNEEGPQSKELVRQMYGEHFYTLLLIFYFKLVLLKLSHDYSKTEFEKDHKEVELLTMMINEFSSRYFLPELNSKQTGKEMAGLMQSIFEIEKLHDKVTQTLTTLFQDQEKIESKKFSSLLQILTIYTVISGIYGMNLVIEDLGGNIDWSKFASFSVFEWLTVFVTATGIILSAVMCFFFIKRWFDERKDKSRKLY